MGNKSMSFLDDVLCDIEGKKSISPTKGANLALLAFSLARLHPPPLLGFSLISPFSPYPMQKQKTNYLAAKCYTPDGGLLFIKATDQRHKEYLERINKKSDN